VPAAPLRPRKAPRQQRAVDTRRRLLDAAGHVFAEFGYARGTTNGSRRRPATRSARSTSTSRARTPSSSSWPPSTPGRASRPSSAGSRTACPSRCRPRCGSASGPPWTTTGTPPSCTACCSRRRPGRRAAAPAARVGGPRSWRPTAELLAADAAVRRTDLQLAARMVVAGVESLVHRFVGWGRPEDTDRFEAELTAMLVQYLTAPDPGPGPDPVLPVGARAVSIRLGRPRPGLRGVPVRTLLVIGIGAGDPEQLTVEAINALNSVEVFFVFGKENAAELTEMRRQNLRALHPHRRLPGRGDRRPAEGPGRRRLRRRGARVAGTPGRRGWPGTGGGSWGRTAAAASWSGATRPSTTARSGSSSRSSPTAGWSWTTRSSPGSAACRSSPRATASRSTRWPARCTSPRGGGCWRGVPAGVDDVVVMLDAGLACAALRHEPGWHIYWGAYLGTKDEALVAGPLDDVPRRDPAHQGGAARAQGLDHGHVPAAPYQGRRLTGFAARPVWAARPLRCTEA